MDSNELFRDSLRPEDAESLLMRLLSWLVRLVSQNEAALVLRKLCAALVAYFIRPSSTWEFCLRHLICSFYSTQAVSTESLNGYPPTADIYPALNQAEAIITLWFGSMLVEEVARTDNDSMQT